MSIASALLALNDDIQKAKTAITAKGGIVKDGDGSSQLEADIATIGTNEHYNFLQDATEAYTKAVHAQAMPKATVDMVGGKSVVRNQLVQNGDFYDDSWWQKSGVVLTVSGNTGTVRQNSTSSLLYKTNLGTVVGHKYLISVSVKLSTSSSGWIVYGLGTYQENPIVRGVSTTEWQNISKVFTLDRNNAQEMYIKDSVDGTQQYILRNFSLIDLTQMFGSAIADTITTPEQAYALGVPREYIPYDTGTIVSAEVQEVESRDADNAIVGTLPIPAAVRALEGYGQSEVGGNGNTVDFERKVYTEIGHYVDDVWTTLVTPVETDISAYLDAPFLDVEGGGSITFKQQTSGLELPVPNKETYLVEAQ